MQIYSKILTGAMSPEGICIFLHPLDATGHFQCVDFFVFFKLKLEKLNKFSDQIIGAQREGQPGAVAPTMEFEMMQIPEPFRLCLWRSHQITLI